VRGRLLRVLEQRRAIGHVEYFDLARGEWRRERVDEGEGDGKEGGGGRRRDEGEREESEETEETEENGERRREWSEVT
jgi:hypothetical protein